MSKESSSSSESSNSDERNKVRDKLKKIKKKIKKELERKAERRLKKKIKKEKKRLKKEKKRKEKEKCPTVPEISDDKMNVVEKTSNIPISLMEASKTMKPMTKEEWEKRQAVIRKVLDEESGRYRLIKGDGEILEEIVPLKKHKEINKQATKADGEYFQAVLHRK